MTGLFNACTPQVGQSTQNSVESNFFLKGTLVASSRLNAAVLYTISNNA